MHDSRRVAASPKAVSNQPDPLLVNRFPRLYIVLISLHGLVRGERMELGRDPDTGGQVRSRLLIYILPPCSCLIRGCCKTNAHEKLVPLVCLGVWANTKCLSEWCVPHACLRLRSVL